MPTAWGANRIDYNIIMREHENDNDCIDLLLVQVMRVDDHSNYLTAWNEFGHQLYFSHHWNLFLDSVINENWIDIIETNKTNPIVVESWSDINSKGFTEIHVNKQHQSYTQNKLESSRLKSIWYNMERHHFQAKK